VAASTATQSANDVHSTGVVVAAANHDHILPNLRVCDCNYGLPMKYLSYHFVYIGHFNLF